MCRDGIRVYNLIVGKKSMEKSICFLPGSYGVTDTLLVTLVSLVDIKWGKRFMVDADGGVQNSSTQGLSAWHI